MYMLKSLYKKTPFAPYIAIIFLTVFSTILLWLPFLLRVDSINGIETPELNFQTVIKHWDGPLYIIPAKTGYDINNNILKQAPLGLEGKYFAAHMPGYPATIAALSPFVGYPKATVLSTLLASIFMYCFFYYFLTKLKITDHKLILTTVLLFLTPRLYVVRSVGSPEPMFILFILTSIYMFVKKKYFWSGILGGLAVITKTPAILLFAAYVLFFVDQWRQTNKIEIERAWLLLIPASLLAVFVFYSRQFGDFFAYFNSGDNLHLIFPPFSVFNFQKDWVGTAWLEEIIFLYFFYGLTLITLWEKIINPPMGGATGLPAVASAKVGREAGQDPLVQQNEFTQRFYKISFYFVLLFFLSIISVQHRDISRYSLPLLPITLITFADFFTSRRFVIVLMLLLPAIYLYAINFMLYNIAPIADWSPFL